MNLSVYLNSLSFLFLLSFVSRPSQDVSSPFLFPLRPRCLLDENLRRPEPLSQRAYSITAIIANVPSRISHFLSIRTNSHGHSALQVEARLWGQSREHRSRNRPLSDGALNELCMDEPDWLSTEVKHFGHNTSHNRTLHVHGLTSSHPEHRIVSSRPMIQRVRTTSITPAALRVRASKGARGHGQFNWRVVVWNRRKIAIQSLSDNSSTFSATFDSCSGSRKRVAWPSDSFDLTDAVWPGKIVSITLAFRQFEVKTIIPCAHEGRVRWIEQACGSSWLVVYFFVTS